MAKFGCIISHLYCLNICINNNYNKFLILEDDIIFHRRISEILTKEIINYDYDMLMLGACDFNFKRNQVNTLNINNMSVYRPIKLVLGAHANIYSLEFAKTIYNYKINSFKENMLEFDQDFNLFYDKKIYVCNPNLVVCELTTTNLDHTFGYNSKDKRMYLWYINTIFPENFKYSNYMYVTIDYINFVKKNYYNINKDDLLKKYIDTLTTLDELNKKYVYNNLKNSYYSFEEMLLM